MWRRRFRLRPRVAMQYDAVLFDFDGVLADSEPVHFARWADIVRPLGLELTWEDFLRQ